MARGKELEAQWSSLRRGWYVGGDGFCRKLLARVDQGAETKTERSARQPHDQSRAEQMLEAGLAALGLCAADLSRLPKGQAEKLVLAWWLYGQTTVKRRWVAERLAMGYETRVSQAVSRVESSRKRAVREMKEKLHRCHV